MWRAASAAAGLAAAAAWAVRGRSSTVFAPSVWRGPATRPALALTFDDGPSESTPAILELLARYGARATFFQIGANADRLPAVARAVAAAGHEIGNHTYSHPRLWLRSARFIEDEVTRAQQSLSELAGAPPRLFRAPYGVRWPGLGAVQARHGLQGVMWSVIARDWSAGPEAVASRLQQGARPGAILCLHDGRELTPQPDIDATLEALRQVLPLFRDRGLACVTVSDLLSSSRKTT